jgi:1-acyl-sn-glycerol-3-phosphate acyltransferase
MRIGYDLVTSTIKSLSRILCRVEEADLARVPDRGPLILVVNHINFLEAPVLYTHLVPRPVTAFAKAENWQNPLMRPLMTLWRIIPLRRGEADMGAIRSAISVLNDGKILAIAPEGTRSGHGRLLRGKPGVALVALHSGSELLPIACYGHEAFWRNAKRLRRTDFRITVGVPFRLQGPGGRVTGQVRQAMVDEVMYQIAALLPRRYRGVYQDLSQASEQYLRFKPGAISNLSLAVC